MKDSKAVNVTKGDLKAYYREVELYSSRVIKDSLKEEHEVYKDFACQYDIKTDICTCKRSRKKYHVTQDVYRAQEREKYPGWKSYTDIGVGSVKTLPKRRTRRIYLPETNDRGIGSSDLLLEKKRHQRDYSYYEQNRTSSKCVGGTTETVYTPVISKKLSPIVQLKSGTTSPINVSVSFMKREPKSLNSIQKGTVTIQTDTIDPKQEKQVKIAQNYNELPKQLTRDIIPKRETLVEQAKIKTQVNVQVHADKNYSSDSLVQHVHNLENPSFDKQSKTSLDIMENKLEREYRKMFVTEKNNSATQPIVDKPSSDLKRASVLRRRFESLRKGVGKKEDSIKGVTEKISSRKSVQSRKDVSIASDPPSLEAKSYSNTKVFSPYTSFSHPYKSNAPVVSLRKTPEKRPGPNTNWSTEIIDSDCQSVRGMFKLWGKKFNLEENNYKKINQYGERTPEKVVEIIVPDKRMKDKKPSKRFFFFNKRSKDNKIKQVFKSKKGVTAGRCEVEDGLTIKFGPKEYPSIPEVINTNEFENYDNILRKSWLKKFLSSKVDSRRSVKIRWNNNMYSTSSSTVFELLDCVYKNTGIVIGSRSEMSTCESSIHYTSNRPRVKFMPKNVEAWMIPKTIIDPLYKELNVVQNQNSEKTRNIEVTYLDRKWYIDKSHRGNKIELVLQSKNIIQTGQSKSSDYILIDIPKGYFTDSVESNHHQTSDEEVYKITDYESPNSKPYLCKQRITDFDTGDHILNYADENIGKDEENVEINRGETPIKNPLRRDVVIQGSQVYIPKHCDVIGVGIITQRDIRDIKKPILKINDDVTDSESVRNLPPLKKCEFAESYLQDYYKNCIPLGIDFFSWCVSDTQLRSSENNSRTSLNNQGDGSKSCPNMIDDYRGSTVVSSCDTSCCSHCVTLESEKKTKEPKKDNFFNKFFCKNSDSAETRSAVSDIKRLLPKDSLEVFKRRKIYADGYNSKWNSLCPKQSSEQSAQKNTQDTPECPKVCKKAKKHVSIPDCEPYEPIEQPCDKCFPGILSYKESNTCRSKEKPKHTCVIPDPVCAIPSKPLCSNLCAKECQPPCMKEKGKKNRPCSGKLPAICGKCSPLQPCELAKLLQINPNYPSLPQKCSKCGITILPYKCPKCCSLVLPLKCPKCSAPVIPLKCAKCCLPIRPQKCPTCPSPTVHQNCPKCCLPILPQKCPKCSSFILPQKCPKCCQPICPQKCPKCSSPVSPQTCPKCCVPILPPKCPNCPLPTTSQKCPKCCISVPPQKCPKCCAIILPGKCPTCPLLILPPKCATCNAQVLPQKCPKCLSQILPQKCPKCSSPSPPQRCPKSCSPILPQKCPNCVSPPSSQKCPKCSSPIMTQKCPKCCTTLSPKKCPTCCTRLLPSKCPKCCTPIMPQRCPKCSTQTMPQKCQKCPSPTPPKKCPKSCSPIILNKCPNCVSSNHTNFLSPRDCPGSPNASPKKPKSSPPRSPCLSPKHSADSIRSSSINLTTKCSPCTRSHPCQRCGSPLNCQVIQPSGLKLQKKPNRCKAMESDLNLPRKCPPPPPPTLYSPIRNKSNESIKNICSKCSNERKNVIRLSSSENIRVNMKKQTASTEEIREPHNIKVQDEDGQTLYERIDYRKISNKNDAILLQNKTCGDSYIHRVSTPSVVLNKIVLNENNYEAQKSVTSENLLEINLTLKFKGDKAEVNICNEGDTPREEKETESIIQPNEIFHMQGQGKESIDNIDKNDVNIKILIKNITNEEYKSRRARATRAVAEATDEFSKNISDKFHTVSTGYSEFIMDQSAYPVEMTTVDLGKSAEKLDTENSSEQFLIEEVMKPDGFVAASSISLAGRTATDNTISSNKNDLDLENKTVSEKFSRGSFKNVQISTAEKSEVGVSMTDDEQFIENYFKRDNVAKDVTILRSKRQKKEMLKKLFEEGSCIDKNDKDTENYKHIKEMLHSILTSDSSGQEDMSDSGTNYDLIKGMTYSSLKPHFKHSDSLNNFYNADNTIVEESNNIDNEVLYPTKEHNSECTNSETDSEKPHHCLCSTLATRLNMNIPGINPCCCRGCDKKDEGVHCDLFGNVKEVVDVETQDSKRLQTYITTNVSTIVKIKSRDSRRLGRNASKYNSFQAFVNEKMQQKICISHKNPLYHRSDEFSSNNSDVDFSDVLQSDDIKKAVLEIYAEKTITNEGTRFIAKLPKFILNNDL